MNLLLLRSAPAEAGCDSLGNKPDPIQTLLGANAVGSAGVKLVNTEKDEVVVDIEAKLAGGEPNILLVAHTITGQRCVRRVSLKPHAFRDERVAISADRPIRAAHHRVEHV